MAKIKKSIDPARSCWHCRFYIRPDLSFTLDAATGSICYVDRDPSLYTGLLQSVTGDQTVHPDDTCARFEIDPPPTQMPLGVRGVRNNQNMDD